MCAANHCRIAMQYRHVGNNINKFVECIMNKSGTIAQGPTEARIYNIGACQPVVNP